MRFRSCSSRCRLSSSQHQRSARTTSCAGNGTPCSRSGAFLEELGAILTLPYLQKHRKLYRDSQLNASQCASFLHSTLLLCLPSTLRPNVFLDYGTVLVPLSRGHMSFKEKTFMINKFIEVCSSMDRCVLDIVIDVHMHPPSGHTNTPAGCETHFRTLP